ncbi:MAG: glucose-6-phosphate isomerase [Planctomycetaceae bacterium]|nr:MAG: glucose-6-phosphate isomerase [Planctomycetaceae bacterium]
MSLIRFDPAGALRPDSGITSAELAALYPQLDRLRRKLLAGDSAASADADANGPTGRLAPVDRFYGLPDELLARYRELREGSELGQIFQVANTIVHQLDAVVVLGAGGWSAGARAMLEACCDPYHNELSRASRGSRPRMYFAGDDLGNDAIQALLGRLSAGGYGVLPPDKRYAITVISPHGDNVETAIAFRQLLSHLRDSLGGESDKWLPKLVLPVTGGSGKLRDMATAIGCETVFDIPDGLHGPYSIFSPAGLLPAALLGLDCMRLLEGAATMNRHFESASPENNVVLQVLAFNHLLARKRGRSIRVLAVWCKELESVGRWYDRLLAESFGDFGLGGASRTRGHMRELPGRHPWYQPRGDDKVVNSLIVEQPRTDPLSVGRGRWNQDGLDDLADLDLTDILAAAIKGGHEALWADGHPTTALLLPTIDTHVLGQLFQLWMIATVMEARLLGMDPHDRSGLEQYETNLSHHLRRS